MNVSDIATFNLKETPFPNHLSAISRIIDIVDTLTLMRHSNQLFTHIVEVVIKTTGADEGVLMLVDEETGKLHIRARKDRNEDKAHILKQEIDDPIASRVIATGTLILLEDSQTYEKEVRIESGAQSLINCPIRKDKEVIGIIGVYNYKAAQTFSVEQRDYLEALAQYAQIAIENVVSYEKDQKRIDKYQDLFVIARKIHLTTSLDEALAQITTAAIDMSVLVDRAVIHLYNPTTKRLEWQFCLPVRTEHLGRGFALGEGLAGQAIQKGTLINCPDVTANNLFRPSQAEGGALLVAPAYIATAPPQRIGTITVRHHEKNTFGQQDEEFLKILANLIVVAVKKHSKFFAYEQQPASRFQLIPQIFQKLTGPFNRDELMEKTVRLIRDSLAYERVALYLYDAEQQRLSLKVQVEANLDQVTRTYISEDSSQPAFLAAQTKRTLRLDMIASDGLSHRPNQATAIQSELYLPLAQDDKIVGVLSLHSLEPYAFNEQAISRLKPLAAKIAHALEMSQQHTTQISPYWRADQSEVQKIGQRLGEFDAVQKVLHEIQSLAGLGLRQVFHNIVDALVNGLGYRGAMVAVVDEEAQLLTVQAVVFDSLINRLGLVERAERSLGIRVIGAYQSLKRDTESLGVQSCLSGETKISKDLYDLFRPVVNRRAARWMQSLSKIKTLISIPLLIEKRAVGNLYAGTTKDHISSSDQATLQRLATNAAIAIQNATLFEQL